MMKYTSEHEKNRAAQQQAEQQAARQFREEADARGTQTNENEIAECCYSWFCAADSILAYVISCCGCCTSYNDWAIEQD